MTLRYEIDKRTDRAIMWLAKRLPRRLRMWVVVDAFATAWAKPPYGTPDEIGYSEVMRRTGLSR